MTILFSNTGASTLSAGVSADTTDILLQPGDGAKFPSPADGQYFVATLSNTAGDLEIVRVIARIGDQLVATRAQEGTTAAAWPPGTLVDMRITAGVLQAFLQQSSALHGSFDAASATFVRPTLFEPDLQGAVISATSLLPPGGPPATGFSLDPSRGPTIGGLPVLHPENVAQYGGVPLGGIIAYHGAVEAIPPGWALCDGTNGTPDLRGRFIRGSAPALPAGITGGAVGTVTEGAGGHAHVGVTGDTLLTPAHLPAHNHTVGIRDFSETHSPGPAVQGYEPMSEGNPGATRTITTSTTPAPTLGHHHDIAFQPDHTHDIVDTLPPFYVLAYIMRVA
jgi:hypothetical protein